MNIRLLITFLHEIFVYIHTFFHRKIMRDCRLITCLYDIQQTSYERRLHRSHVAPSVPIWAEFAFTLGNIYPQPIRAVTSVLFVCASSPRLYISIYYWGKIRLTYSAHAHMRKSGSIFSRRAIICTVYYWEKCKKIVRCDHACARSTPRFLLHLSKA